jgi:hypothetical protein
VSGVACHARCFPDAQQKERGKEREPKQRRDKTFPESAAA